MTRNLDDVPRVLKALKTAMESLPSEEEIARSVEAIDQITGFLADLRRHLVEQPTATRREDLQKATLVLESFLTAHRGRVLFTEPRRTGKAPTEETHEISDIRRDLEQLPLEAVQQRLLDESLFSTATLRELAKDLGLRLDPKLSRDDLADAIYKRGFANPRGYAALREAKHLPEATVEVPAERSPTSRPPRDSGSSTAKAVRRR
jgi:hypothetical protein